MTEAQIDLLHALRNHSVYGNGELYRSYGKLVTAEVKWAIEQGYVNIGEAWEPLGLRSAGLVALKEAEGLLPKEEVNE